MNDNQAMESFKNELTQQRDKLEQDKNAIESLIEMVMKSFNVSRKDAIKTIESYCEIIESYSL